MEDDAFFEWFVPGIDGYITDNLSKKGYIINGTLVKYHSLCIKDEDQLAFDAAIANAQPGSVITLDFVPLSINVELPENNKMQLSVDAWKHMTLVTGKIVLPLLPKRKGKSWGDIAPTAIPGGDLYRPSRVKLMNYFPIEPAFAMTVDKAQGRTMPRVILALSSRSSSHCQMTYAAIYVALSRVRNRNDIRLLLSGTNYAEQRDSLLYLSTLKRDKSIDAFFAGYPRVSKNHGWKKQTWNSEIAYQHWKNK